MEARKAALILMKTSQFDRTLRYYKTACLLFIDPPAYCVSPSRAPYRPRFVLVPHPVPSLPPQLINFLFVLPVEPTSLNSLLPGASIDDGVKAHLKHRYLTERFKCVISSSAIIEFGLSILACWVITSVRHMDYPHGPE